jgi:hypothetical protein
MALGLALTTGRLLAQTPVSSNGSLGALNVMNGNLLFNTNFADPVLGGTYSINGVQQSGLARLLSIPASPGFSAATPGHGTANVFVYDFSAIGIAPGVNVSVVGPSSLILLSSSSAQIGATFNLAGNPGQAGGPKAGGGGGGGGGNLSIFAGNGLTFSGFITVSGGNGGLSYQTTGNPLGGQGGADLGGGGVGGAGGFAQAGGKGGNGGNGALVGFAAKGVNLGIFLDGGGGGGGGAYRGGPGGGGASGGNAGAAGALGACPAAAAGGVGGASRTGGGFFGGDGGAAGGGNGTNGFLGGGGGGGGGGNAPNGQPGGAGGSGSIGAGGGGGGGGGDLCMSSPSLQNGGGGGGGGGDGGPGSVITASASASGGGGGGGQVYLGTNTGSLIFQGVLDALGGTALSGNGGVGRLSLIAPSPTSVSVFGGRFNGSPLTLTSANVNFATSVSLSDFQTYGGAGGGGAGGPGQVIPEPGTVALLASGLVPLALLRVRRRRNRTC